MKRSELQVGEEYIVAAPLVRLDASMPEPANVHRVVLADTHPWEYADNGTPRPVDKGTGLLVVERTPTGDADRRVLPIGQFRMTATEYDRARKQAERRRKNSQRHLTVRQLDFAEGCRAAGLAGTMFGEFEGDTSQGRDGRHWYETRRGIVGMSLDTFLGLVQALDGEARRSA